MNRKIKRFISLLLMMTLIITSSYTSATVEASNKSADIVKGVEKSTRYFKHSAY